MTSKGTMGATRNLEPRRRGLEIEWCVRPATVGRGKTGRPADCQRRSARPAVSDDERGRLARENGIASHVLALAVAEDGRDVLHGREQTRSSQASGSR